MPITVMPVDGDRWREFANATSVSLSSNVAVRAVHAHSRIAFAVLGVGVDAAGVVAVVVMFSAPCVVSSVLWFFLWSLVPPSMAVAALPCPFTCAAVVIYR